MKKAVVILVCLMMAASVCLTVNADDLPVLKTPVLPGSSIITQPALPEQNTIINPSLPGVTLPSTNLPDIITDPRLEPLTFTAPSELKLVKTEHNQVSLQWKDNSVIETRFVVERKKTDGMYTQLVVLGKDAVTYEDNSVDPSTTYYYRVKAGVDKLDPGTMTFSTNYTLYSNELMVNTPASTSIIIKEPPGGITLPEGLAKPPIVIDPGTIVGTVPGTTTETTPETPSETTTDENTTETTAPETVGAAEIKAPEALAAEAVSESKIALSWQDKSDNESGFLLYRTYTGEWEEAAVLDADTIDYTDENLQSNTTYYYVLFAYKDSDASPQSNIAEITTPEPAAAQAATLAAPEALTAQAQSPTEVILTWQDKSNDEEGFLLYRTATGEWEQAAKLSANVTTYTDKAVKPNTKYYYVVYAYIGETPSKESNIAEVTTPNQAAAASTVDLTGASSWALEELAKAVEYGLYTDRIMNNYSQNITREEFCELVIKLYEKLKGTAAAPASPNPFSDTTNENILKAYGAGIVNGTSKDTFSPSNPITRQDICVMLYRAITGAAANVNTSTDGVPVFADENLIGSWAAREVKFAFKNNIMKGSDSKIMPRDNTNREQALLLVKRVYEIFAAGR